ncbi:hypothetical protein EYD10_16245 [Varanus komodoensis]|nr:hypothetical protein EYD10_16245 [Varanus komodoensis]
MHPPDPAGCGPAGARLNRGCAESGGGSAAFSSMSSGSVIWGASACVNKRYQHHFLHGTLENLGLSGGLPSSLKRGLLPSHCREDCSSKRSRTSSISSVNSLSVGGIPSTVRNAIASSYSSTRGLSQLWKRSGPGASPLSSPASSCPQTPERPSKKARHPSSSLTEEESRRSRTSTPVKADKEVQAEKAEEAPPQSSRSSPGPLCSLGSGGSTRKRRIQLLSTHHDDRFSLVRVPLPCCAAPLLPGPPPPQLSYSVTSEDLDAEKKAALQWFSKVLEEDTGRRALSEGLAAGFCLPHRVTRVVEGRAIRGRCLQQARASARVPVGRIGCWAWASPGSSDGLPACCSCPAEPAVSAPPETSSTSATSSFALMPARPSPVLSTQPAGGSPLLESLKKMQEGPSTVGQAGE